MTDKLNFQVNRFGFWSAVVVLVTAIASFFLPLDVPGGYDAAHADRVEWLNTNLDAFILGWINQMVAMFSLSFVLLGAAWDVMEKNPLRAILAAIVITMSVVAFIIPKFIAIWTIPQLAQTIAMGATGADLAESLLRMLNVSIPFSLYTSFDYLGFWLYAIFGLLVAGPLYGESLSSKVAAVTAGILGLSFHVLFAALLAGAIESAEVESAFMSVFSLLLILVLVMLVHFRDSMTKAAQ